MQYLRRAARCAAPSGEGVLAGYLRAVEPMPKLADDVRATRRSRILAAALNCFAHSGYHSTTMADVAMEAGVSKGTPYLYFPSKEVLYVAL